MCFARHVIPAIIIHRRTEEKQTNDLQLIRPVRILLPKTSFGAFECFENNVVSRAVSAALHTPQLGEALAVTGGPKFSPVTN